MTIEHECNSKKQQVGNLRCKTLTLQITLFACDVCDIPKYLKEGFDHSRLIPDEVMAKCQGPTTLEAWNVEGGPSRFRKVSLVGTVIHYSFECSFAKAIEVIH